MNYPPIDPHKGESLKGFLLRFITENAIPRIGNILRDADIARFSRAHDDGELARLSAVIGVTVDRLREMQPTRIGRTSAYSFMGGNYERRMLAFGRPRFCPICFGHSGYHQLIWQFQPLTHCAHHGCPLISHCSCGEPFRWARQHDPDCDCGRPIAENVRPKEVDLFGIRLVYEALGTEISWVPLIPELPPEIADLASDELVRVLLILGNIDLFERPFGRFQWRSDDEKTPVLVAGAELLRDWPAAFHQRLERSRSENLAAYLRRPLAVWLARMLERYPTPSIRLVVREVQSAAAAQGYWGYLGAPLPAGKRHLLSRTEAAAMCGGRDRLAKIERTWKLRDPALAHSPHFDWIVLDKLKECLDWLGRDRSDEISFHDAGDWLGVTPATFRKMVDAGFLGDAARHMASLNRYANFIKRADVKALLMRIRKRTKRPVVSDQAKLVLWASVNRTVYSSANAQIQVLEEILRGNLTPREFDGRLCSIKIDRQELRQFLFKQPTSPKLQIGDAAKEAGVTVEFIRRAVSLNLIKVSRNRKRELLERNSLERFLEHYAFGNRLRKLFDLPPREAHRLLTRHGKHPIRPRSGDYLNCKIWKMSDINDVLNTLRPDECL